MLPKTLIGALVLLGTLLTPMIGLGASDPSLGADDHGSDDGWVKICHSPSTVQGLLQGNENALPAQCDHGHFYRGSINLWHGFPYFIEDLAEEEEWNGWFESWLIHDDGPDTGIGCRFSDGSIGNCQNLGGAYPSWGSEFEHKCYAFDSHMEEIPIAETPFGCALLGASRIE